MMTIEQKNLHDRSLKASCAISLQRCLAAWAIPDRQSRLGNCTWWILRAVRRRVLEHVFSLFTEVLFIGNPVWSSPKSIEFTHCHCCPSCSTAQVAKTGASGERLDEAQRQRQKRSGFGSMSQILSDVESENDQKLNFCWLLDSSDSDIRRRISIVRCLLWEMFQSQSTSFQNLWAVMWLHSYAMLASVESPHIWGHQCPHWSQVHPRTIPGLKAFKSQHLRFSLELELNFALTSF